MPGSEGQAGVSGTPILGSGGTAYRGVLRRNPAAANTATANAASQPMVADVATNGAVGSAVGELLDWTFYCFFGRDCPRDIVVLYFCMSTSE